MSTISLAMFSRLDLKNFCFHFSFGGFEQIKLYLVDENGNLSGSGKLIAGLGAGVLEAIFAGGGQTFSLTFGF